MIDNLFKLIKLMETLERKKPRIFWFFTGVLGLLISQVHSPEINPIQDKKTPIVIEQNRKSVLDINRGGGNNSENINTGKIPIHQSKSTSTHTNPEPVKASKMTTSESKNLRSRTIGLPNGNNNSPNGGSGGYGETDPVIGTKNWEEWQCPDPDKIISQPDFWSTLQNDKDPEICEEDETIAGMKTIRMSLDRVVDY